MHQWLSFILFRSKTEDEVIFAAVLSSQILNGYCHGAASVFTAEMYTIKTATENLFENHNELGNNTIFSDFQNVLLALKSNFCNSAMIAKIQLLRNQTLVKEIYARLFWVHGHSGVTRNEN